MALLSASIEEKTTLLQELIDQSQRIVFFGGAGVSTESGIPDFRSVDGLYNQKWAYPPEEILSNGFFIHNPAEFYRFYREKILVQGIKPNPAHYKLAELEQKGKLNAVITQNIDGLHQAAGSKNVFELHGTVLKNHCTKCREFFDGDYVFQNKDKKGIPRCSKCNSIIKPDVVLYGESLDGQTITNSILALQKADLLIIGGTSLTVFPAAGLIDYYQGQNIVLINKTPTPGDAKANLVIHGSIGTILSRITV